MFHTDLIQALFETFVGYNAAYKYWERDSKQMIGYYV